MPWNNRVQIDTYTHTDQSVEYTASIVEVFYGDKVGSTDDVTPVGSGASERDAVLELKNSLELMLESVNYVLSGKTPVFCPNDESTHIPGEPSQYIRRQEFLDRDDAFMNERYGDNDDL